MRHNNSKQTVAMLGPALETVSGVSTHLNALFASAVTQEFALMHFQVGSEGRNERGVARWARLLLSPLLLAVTIFARRVAIVHLNTSLNARAYWRDLVYLIVAKLCGTSVLYQVHGGALPQQFLGCNRIATAFLRATLRLPNAIVVLAQCERDAYRAFVPAQSIVMIPNAIDAAAFAACVRVRAGPATALRLAYVGRLIREKGLYETLEGLRLARVQGIDARLVIAGSGPEEASLRRHVDEAALAPHVSVTGPVFGERKVAMLAETDLFMLPTYHPEGLPYALLEAMAAGVPVITTRVGGIPDVVVEGVHGEFVPPRDPAAISRAIGRFASNRETLARMSAACRTRITADYSVERLSEEFCRLYFLLCAARRPKLSIES